MYPNNTSPGLHSLELTNFQAFAERVSIPLGRIVLLFGPNSAGKSAVLDGLQILNEMLASFAAANYQFENPTFRREPADAEAWVESLKRHVRRQPSSGLDSFAEAFAPTPTCISAEMLVSTSDLTRRIARWASAAGPERTHEVRIDLQIAPVWFDEKIGWLWPVSLGVTVDGRLLLKFEEWQSIALDMGHEVLRSLELSTQELDAFLEIGQARLTADGTLYSWELEACFTQWRLEIGMMKDAFYDDAQGDETGASRRSADYERLGYRAFDKFADAFENVLGIVCAAAHSASALTCVDASRRIPSPNDLCYQLEYLPHGHARRAQVPGLRASGAPEFEKLTEGLFIAWWQSKSSDSLTNLHEEPFGARVEKLHERVNRALSENLFVEKLYRCAVDVQVLLDATSVKQLLVDSTCDSARLASAKCLVRLTLQDNEGRQLEFVDVGSGLGYVLPVLVCLHDRAGHPMVFIQQPELHLHPALQAALGDVVLEATQGSRSTIIETHSEHLLLRLLRRVRQNSRLNIALPTESSISPDELVVLYFDPQLSGQTVVRRLRVSEDGDFLDRWPRGFFDERDRELFGDEGLFGNE